MAIQLPLVTPLGRKILLGRLDPALRMLTYREREIIKLRYGLSVDDDRVFTRTQVAWIFNQTGVPRRNMTSPDIARIEAIVFRKLRHSARRKLLADFLDTVNRLKVPERLVRFANLCRGK